MEAFIMYGEELEGLPESGAFLVLVPRGQAGRAFLHFIEEEAPLVFYAAASSRLECDSSLLAGEW